VGGNLSTKDKLRIDYGYHIICRSLALKGYNFLSKFMFSLMF
jgi:hypothetical protein